MRLHVDSSRRKQDDLTESVNVMQGTGVGPVHSMCTRLSDREATSVSTMRRTTVLAWTKCTLRAENPCHGHTSCSARGTSLQRRLTTASTRSYDQIERGNSVSVRRYR